LLHRPTASNSPNIFALRSPKVIHLLPGEHGGILGKLEVGLALVRSFGTASATSLDLYCWIIPISVLHNKSASRGYLLRQHSFLVMRCVHSCFGRMAFAVNRQSEITLNKIPSRTDKISPGYLQATANASDLNFPNGAHDTNYFKVQTSTEPGLYVETRICNRFKDTSLISPHLRPHLN